MSNLTDFKIRNMTNFVSEPVNSRGDGTLYLEERKDSIEAYYRYSYKGTRPKIKIGNYKIKKVGLTLKEMREEGRRLSALQKLHLDLKSYLERIEQERIAKE